MIQSIGLFPCWFFNFFNMLFNIEMHSIPVTTFRFNPFLNHIPPSRPVSVQVFKLDSFAYTFQNMAIETSKAGIDPFPLPNSSLSTCFNSIDVIEDYSDSSVQPLLIKQIISLGCIDRSYLVHMSLHKSLLFLCRRLFNSSIIRGHILQSFINSFDIVLQPQINSSVAIFVLSQNTIFPQTSFICYELLD